MTDSCILEKVFKTLTGLKFETLFLSLDYLSIRETDVNTVIYSIHEWLRKHFSRHFHQFRINFISSCSLFGVYIFKKPINFRSGYTIKLKLCVSLWIVKILFYFWYARVITIMLHTSLMTTSLPMNLCQKQSCKVFVPKIIPLHFAFFNNSFTIIN